MDAGPGCWQLRCYFHKSNVFSYSARQRLGRARVCIYASLCLLRCIKHALSYITLTLGNLRPEARGGSEVVAELFRPRISQSWKFFFVMRPTLHCATLLECGSLLLKVRPVIPAAGNAKFSDSQFRLGKQETHSGPMIVMKMTKIATAPRRMPCTVA
jgi:hypothetical protein